jgi:hypothetical protein
VAISPLRLDTTGIRGASKRRPVTTVLKSASIEFIRGEWNAWLTGKRLDFRPRSAKLAAISPVTCAFPEITSEPGPLIAAIETSSVSSGVTSSSVAWIATIAPSAGNACIRRARASTSLHAFSRSSTPATWAAAISPIEWPVR